MNQDGSATSSKGGFADSSNSAVVEAASSQVAHDLDITPVAEAASSEVPRDLYIRPMARAPHRFEPLP